MFRDHSPREAGRRTWRAAAVLWLLLLFRTRRISSNSRSMWSVLWLLLLLRTRRISSSSRGRWSAPTVLPLSPFGKRRRADHNVPAIWRRRGRCWCLCRFFYWSASGHNLCASSCAGPPHQVRSDVPRDARSNGCLMKGHDAGGALCIDEGRPGPTASAREHRRRDDVLGPVLLSHRVVLPDSRIRAEKQR